METRVNFMKYLRRTILLGTSLILFGLASTNTVSVKADSSITSTTISAPNISDQTYYHSSATQLAKMVRSGKVTPQQLIEHAVAKIKADNPQLNAVISLREDQAMKEAANLKDTGQPFYGVPLLIKGLGQPIVGSSNTRGLVPLADQKGNHH